MDFAVIDVETANQNPRSICQIGIATFKKGLLADLWCSMINPEEPFLALNIAIHGIRDAQVVDAPNWKVIQPELQLRIRQSLLASHTLFDLRAIKGANERYRLTGTPWMNRWVDTCKIARSAWPSLSSHRLPDLARVFGIPYQAHNAAEDARCAGEILVLALKTTKRSLRSPLRTQDQ